MSGSITRGKPDSTIRLGLPWGDMLITDLHPARRCAVLVLVHQPEGSAPLPERILIERQVTLIGEDGHDAFERLSCGLA